MFLETVPPILVLHLKLFDYDVESGANRKVLKRITYHENFEIPRDCFLHHGRGHHGRGGGGGLENGGGGRGGGGGGGGGQQAKKYKLLAGKCFAECFLFLTLFLTSSFQILFPSSGVPQRRGGDEGPLHHRRVPPRPEPVAAL